MVEVLARATDDPGPDAPTARAVIVVPTKLADGATKPQIFLAELSWKEYTLLQRLHLIDHRTQIKTIHAVAAGEA